MTYVATPSITLSASARWRIVLLLMAYTALGHFNREGLAVAGNKIFINQLDITEVRMGWVYTSFLICYTIGMLPGGWLIDRIGSVKTLTMYGLAMGAVIALTGTLNWVSSEPLSLWIGLLVIRGLTGLCSSPLHPGAAHVAADSLPQEYRASANGMRTAGALLGIAFSYPIFNWLIETAGWPGAFVVSGAILMVFGLFWKLSATALIEPRSAHGSTTTDERATREEILSLLCNGNLWLVSLSYAAYGYFQYLFFYWMGYYFEKVLHVPDDEARQASFYIFLAMGAGMAIGGLSTDIACKLFGTIRGRRSIVVIGMGLGALFALLAVNGTEQSHIVAYLAISMGCLGMCEGVFWTTATDIGGKSRGFSGAFMNTLGNVGGFISPVLTPYMAEAMGWPGAIKVACAIAAFGGMLWFVIKPPVR